MPQVITLLGIVWDKTHIISNNVSFLVYDIPEDIIGQFGYCLIESKNGVNILLKFINR